MNVNKTWERYVPETIDDLNVIDDTQGIKDEKRFQLANYLWIQLFEKSDKKTYDRCGIGTMLALIGNRKFVLNDRFRICGSVEKQKLKIVSSKLYTLVS